MTDTLTADDLDRDLTEGLTRGLVTKDERGRYALTPAGNGRAERLLREAGGTLPFRQRRIYVASSWRCPLQPGVVHTLRAAGHAVFDFRNPPGRTGFQWSQVDPDWQQWTPATYRDALEHPVSIAGYDSDFDAMHWADTCVLVLPCGRSAHLEAGYMRGSGRDLYILQIDHAEPELMYRMATQICVTKDELLACVGVQPEQGAV